jgi:Uma2 family endonuclease
VEYNSVEGEDAMAAITGLTVEDFERLPVDQVENHDLVDGELVPVSQGTFEHQSICGLLIAKAHPVVYGVGRVVAEVKYDFGGNVHAPDVSFIGLGKVPLIQPKKSVQRFVPDLAIEVVSTHEVVNELWCKRERYRACGTAEVWIVFPETREAYIYSDTGDRILRGNAELSTPLIPGFRMTLDELFHDLIAP